MYLRIQWSFNLIQWKRKFSVKTVGHWCDLEIWLWSMKVVWTGKAQWVVPSCEVGHLSHIVSKKITTLKSLSCPTITWPAVWYWSLHRLILCTRVKKTKKKKVHLKYRHIIKTHQRSWTKKKKHYYSLLLLLFWPFCLLILYVLGFLQRGNLICFL